MHPLAVPSVAAWQQAAWRGAPSCCRARHAAPNPVLSQAPNAPPPPPARAATGRDVVLRTGPDPKLGCIPHPNAEMHAEVQLSRAVSARDLYLQVGLSFCLSVKFLKYKA